MDAKLILSYIKVLLFCLQPFSAQFSVGDFLQKLNKHFCNVRECLGFFIPGDNFEAKTIFPVTNLQPSMGWSDS